VKRAWVACSVVTLVALGVHVLSSSWLGARDPIALATSGHVVSVVIVAGALFVARAALLVAPGLWLWLAVRRLIDRG